MAPVWFAYDGRHVYFTASPDSFKATRIRRGSAVAGRVGGSDGPGFEGQCAAVTEPDVIENLGRQYSAKYWIAWLGLFRPRVSRVASGQTVAFRFVPRDAEPPSPPDR